MLKLHDLSVEFDEGFQLKHINWQIEQHQHWLITGANGAGKSALAAVLVGYGDILACPQCDPPEYPHSQLMRQRGQTYQRH